MRNFGLLFAAFIFTSCTLGFKGVILTVDPSLNPRALPTGITTPSPSAEPTATKTPHRTEEPTATSTPQPTSSPSPTAGSTNPPHCTESIGSCVHTFPGENGKYRAKVYQAMEAVFAKHPEIFYNKGTAACQWEVPEAYVGLYMQYVQDEIHLIYNQFCTAYKHDNINVKIDNSYGEEFHPLRSDGDIPPSQCVSDINGIYVQKCAPANF